MNTATYVQDIEKKFYGGNSPLADGGIFVMETKLARGTRIRSHVHQHGHIGILVSGQALLEVDHTLRTLYDYATVEIPAGATHSVVAITDCIWLCVWKTDLADEPAMREPTPLYKLGPEKDEG